MPRPPARYRMPAEWSPHEATWLAWPHDPQTWIAGIEPAEDAFLDMIEALAPGERVELLAHDEAQARTIEARLDDRGLDQLQAPPEPEDAARQTVPDRGVVRIHVAGHADCWVRDYGPTFVVDEETDRLAAIDWTFDAWGGKYETLAEDDRLGAFIAATAGAEHVRVDATMEGGSFDVDGEGRLLTTEQCLLHENRNPELSRAEIETLLAEHLGVQEVCWLGEGIVGDDTDGHVDDVARFAGPSTVLAAVEPDASDPNHEPLAENLRRLTAWAEAREDPVEIVELPMPDPVVFEGQRFPASYANLYIGNETVLVPVYDDPADAQALDHVRACFPKRSVAPIDAEPLIVGMGACHCLTQQVPHPKLLDDRYIHTDG